MRNIDEKSMVMQFISLNKDSIYRLAYSYVRNKDDALDVVQDAIYKAMKTKASLKDPSAVKSWFYRIVVHTSLDFLRKRKKVQPMEDEKLQTFMDGAEDVYSDIDIEKTLEELPEKYRSVIVLRFFEDLKIEEVADVLNENVNTIKTRLYQALHVLKGEMKDYISKEER
ncbi:RNA polymerase sigma factor [Paenibacillus pinisoli]|nr:sigma-70 family RNA polymerase sigma factor [Paenibacillus pinisoli]